MKNLSVYNDIFKEFDDQEIALNATILISINCAIYPTDDELFTNGLYVDRLKEYFDTVLWELPQEKRELCLKIWKAHHTYNICKDLNGLGGCVKKSYKEIING